MAVTKFQSESIPPAGFATQFENRPNVSNESITANLESIILGIAINNEINHFDEFVLDSFFADDDRLFIMKDNNRIYPASTYQGEFSFCLDFQDEQLNVCDLHNKYPVLVDRIEQAWPSLITTSSRIKESFAISDAAILINRSSGRIIAVSKGFTAITGIAADEAVGHEHGEISRELDQIFAGKKISLENLNIDELYLSLVSITAASKKHSAKSTSKEPQLSSPTNSHRLVNETQAVDLHLNRFNALLEANLQIAIPPVTLQKLEQIISEMTRFCLECRQTARSKMDSANINACLRLLIQSVLMSHRSLAGEISETDILVFRDENDALQIRFDTPLNPNSIPNMENNEWRQLAESLARRIGIGLSDFKFTEQAIMNKILITNESIQPNDKY